MDTVNTVPSIYRCKDSKALVNQDLFSKRRFDLTWASDSSSGEVKSSSLLAYRISIIRQVSGSKVSMTGSVTDSGSGGFLCGFSFFGWIPVVIGLIVIVVSFTNGAGLMGILVASSPIVVGLLMVMFAQVAIAILDIADNSRETRRMTALMLQEKKQE